MRAIPTILMIACVSVAFGAGAHAQEALKLCRQIKDDAERLKCYDGLDTSSSTAAPTQAESKQGTDGAWEVRDEKSPLDDTPVVSAQLPSSDGKAYLLMRCKDRKTEVRGQQMGLHQMWSRRTRHLPRRSSPSRRDAVEFAFKLRPGHCPIADPIHSDALGRRQGLFPDVGSPRRCARRIIQCRQDFRDPFPPGAGLQLGRRS